MDEAARFEQARQLFVEGMQHAGAGSLILAERRLLAALELAPGRASILINLSALELRLGHADAALTHARQVLAQDPADLDAGFNAARALTMLGRHREAEECLEGLLARAPQTGAAWALRAEVKMALQEPDAALACLDEAIALRGAPEDWSARALLLAETGRTDEALQSLDTALSLRPDDARDWHNRGALLACRKRYAEAVLAYRRALALAPGDSEAASGCAAALLELRFFDEALRCCDLALEREGDDQISLIALRGAALAGLGRHDEALQCLDEALRRQPDSPSILTYRGNCLLEQARDEEALQHFEDALRIAPDFIPARYNAGVALGRLHRHEAAIACQEQVLASDPAHVDASCNRGFMLAEAGRYEEALNSYARCLEIDEHFATAHWNSGCVHLAVGDFERGWAGYEYRWQMPNAGRLRHQEIETLPDVAAAAGKRVLVWHEQGLGDTLQFSRYAALLAQAGAKVWLEVQPPLRSLLTGLHPAVQVLADDTDCARPFDYQIALCSLPRLFGTRVDNIPPPVTPRLDVARAAKWAGRFNGQPLKLALAVSGSRSLPNDKRPVPLAMLIPALRQAEAYVLQTELSEDDRRCLGPHLHWLGPELTDFHDTAAIIAQVDLVITICTSLAHLAGTMGKPTWVLLPYSADWRWLLGRDDSPWYPSVRLFRQPAPGQWAPVVQALAASLEAFSRR